MIFRAISKLPDLDLIPRGFGPFVSLPHKRYIASCRRIRHSRNENNFTLSNSSQGIHSNTGFRHQGITYTEVHCRDLLKTF